MENMHSDIIVKGLRPYSTVFSNKSPESLLPNRRQLPPSTSGDINPKTLIFLKYLKYGLDIHFQLVLELAVLVHFSILNTINYFNGR